MNKYCDNCYELFRTYDEVYEKPLPSTNKTVCLCKSCKDVI